MGAETLRGGNRAGIRAKFTGTGRECAGRVWKGMVYISWRTGLRRGVFPAPAGEGSLPSLRWGFLCLCGASFGYLQRTYSPFSLTLTNIGIIKPDRFGFSISNESKWILLL